MKIWINAIDTPFPLEVFPSYLTVETNYKQFDVLLNEYRGYLYDNFITPVTPIYKCDKIV